MVRTAFLGGSLSKGEGVKKEKCFVSVFQRKSKIPIDVVWGGESGTMSANGIFRVDELLSKDPELVFLDYSMNDTGERYLGECMEGIVRALLRKNIQVVILFFCNSHGSCTRGAMEKIAEHYGLPAFDIGKIIFGKVQSGELDWEQYASDYVHPTAYGHELIADLLCQWVAEQDFLHKREKQQPFVEETAFLGSFNSFEITNFGDKMKDITPGTVVFSSKVKGKMFLIEFVQNSEKNPAGIVIEVNKSVRIIANAYGEYAWGNRVALYLCGDGTCQEYEIKIYGNSEQLPMGWDYSRMDFKLLTGK